MEHFNKFKKDILEHGPARKRQIEEKAEEERSDADKVVIDLIAACTSQINCADSVFADSVPRVVVDHLGLTAVDRARVLAEGILSEMESWTDEQRLKLIELAQSRWGAGAREPAAAGAGGGGKRGRGSSGGADSGGGKRGRGS